VLRVSERRFDILNDSMLACMSALDCAGGVEGGQEEAAVAVACLDRAVPRTAADDDVLELVLGNDLTAADFTAAADDKAFDAAVDVVALAAAADEGGGQAAVFDSGDFFAIPAVVFGFIFADEGPPPLRVPKLLLPLLLLLLLLLPTLLRALLRLLLPQMPVLLGRGVRCRGLLLLPTRRAVEAPLHTTGQSKQENHVAKETHLQVLSRALLRRKEEEEEEEGVAGLTLQAAAPSSRRFTGPTSISAVHTSLYCSCSSLQIFSWPSCA
jgi:hypothetical protein